MLSATACLLQQHAWCMQHLTLCNILLSAASIVQQHACLVQHLTFFDQPPPSAFNFKSFNTNTSKTEYSCTWDFEARSRFWCSNKGAGEFICDLMAWLSVYLCRAYALATLKFIQKSFPSEIRRENCNYLHDAILTLTLEFLLQMAISPESYLSLVRKWLVYWYLLADLLSSIFYLLSSICEVNVQIDPSAVAAGKKK